MADNVTLNSMSGGATVATDEVTDGTLGTVQVQYVKIMDGTLNGTTKSSVDATYGLKVDVARVPTTITVVERGATITDGSASVTTTAAAVTALALDTTRRAITIQNLGTDYVWIGTTTIAVGRGIRLSPGQTLVLDKAPTPAIWAVASSGTQTISYLIEKD